MHPVTGGPPIQQRFDHRHTDVSRGLAKQLHPIGVAEAQHRGSISGSQTKMPFGYRDADVIMGKAMGDG